MLSKDIFATGMQQLKDYYHGWWFKLDETPDNARIIAEWYIAFSEFSDEQFVSMVKYYKKVSSKGPNSPYDLYAPMIGAEYDCYLTADEAFLKVVTLIKSAENEGCEYSNYKFAGDRDRFLMLLDKYRFLKDTYLEFEDGFPQRLDDPYFINAFKKAYAERVKRNINASRLEYLNGNASALKFTNSKYLIGNNNKRLEA